MPSAPAQATTISLVRCPEIIDGGAGRSVTRLSLAETTRKEEYFIPGGGPR
ncbi:hypothetical protein GCM10010404_22080 [Nonomuraea africana]